MTPMVMPLTVMLFMILLQLENGALALQRKRVTVIFLQ
jgi:hypothetical protein